MLVKWTETYYVPSPSPHGNLVKIKIQCDEENSSWQILFLESSRVVERGKRMPAKQASEHRIGTRRG